MNPQIKKLQQDKKGFFVLLGFKGDCEQIRAINSDFANDLIMWNDFILSEDEYGFKTWDFKPIRSKDCTTFKRTKDMSKDFNWLTEIDKAIKREPNGKKFLDLNKRANDWVICSSGELCEVLPRDDLGRPLDNELYDAGTAFMSYISWGYWTDAKRVLDRIEARTAELLNEQK